MEELKMGGLDANLVERSRASWVEFFINKQMKFNPDANQTVLQFIADFIYHGVPNVPISQSCESIRSTFRAGYCYYFAVMLKAAFGRGTICWAAPYGHIVWVDEDGVPYDVEGVSDSECDYYIPISFLGESIADFMHVKGKEFGASKEYICDIISRYRISRYVDEVTEGDSKRYIVKSDIFEQLKSCFLSLLQTSGYQPKDVSLDEISRQIAVHYVACLENEPSEDYVNNATMFDTVAESAQWFWDTYMEPLSEYDAEI